MEEEYIVVSPIAATFEFFGFGRKPRTKADAEIKLIKEQIAYDRRALDEQLAPMQRFWIKNHLAKADCGLPSFSIPAQPRWRRPRPAVAARS